MEISYLPKLLLQHDDSPWQAKIPDKEDVIKAAQHHTLACCIHPGGQAICLALTQRVVVLHVIELCSEKENRREDVVPHFFAPVIKPETVTAVAWIDVKRNYSSSSISKSHVSGLNLDKSCILVGTSTGALQIHLVDGLLLHRQEIHPSAVNFLHVRESGSSIDPDDCSGDITIMFEAVVARISVLDIVALHARHVLASKDSTASEHTSMSVSKWELKGDVGPRYGGSFVGSAPRQLYHILSRRKEANKSLLLTFGSNPPLATFAVEENATHDGVLSAVGNLAFHSATALFTKAKGVIPFSVFRSGKSRSEASDSASRRGFGVGATDSLYMSSGSKPFDSSNQSDQSFDMEIDYSLGEVSTKSNNRSKDRQNGVNVYPNASVWDDKRHVFSMSLSPCCRRAACCDHLGRVIIVDVISCTVICILKGYRDAQATWHIPHSNKHHENIDSQYLESVVKVEAGDSNIGSSLVQNQMLAGPVLVIYAPRRGTLEVWDYSGSSKLGSIKGAPLRGILISQPFIAKSLISSSILSREFHSTKCWMIDLENLQLRDMSSEIGFVCSH